MDKRKAKQNISKLVEKYQRIAKEGKIKSYNEAQTRNEFIEPLFGFLGWDMRNANNDNEVTTEEAISNGRVDLAFRINGIPKFFLEAKSLKTDLDIENYARQAINYSWNKGVNWAVLTDFEGIKIFNANAKSKYLRDKLVFEISCNEYISDLERLWLFSKESFEKNALDIYAEKHGKKSKKLTVNEKLFGDLKQAREILTKSFNNWKGHWDKNKDIDQETLDEGVQRILDRLVFIRVLEDRELEPPILQPIIRDWEKDRSGNKQLFQMLTQKFRELNDIYNSNLFTKHACEDWEEYDDATKKVIELLYGNDVYEYNFREIPMEILGGVYESYLGYIAQKPIVGMGLKPIPTKDKKDLKIKSRKKRKEQGIYYTPNFIVDYIVKNTLGKKLEEVKSMHELKQIKVLDPACGSGSFLIKALEAINNKYKDFNNPGKQDTKSEILLSNIYGVDLDSQAVELAKLNLLINALDQKAKLPNLTDNIRIGNSLISGTEKELKKYFGKNWQDKKPFNWEEEFSFCHSQSSSCHSRGGGNPESGFDVIIGNPPYIGSRELNQKDKNYFGNNFLTAKDQYDLYVLFVEKSLNLLKSGGLLSFIIPNKFLVTKYGLALRKFIFENSTLINFKDYSKERVFPDASVYPVVVVLKKEVRLNADSNKTYDLLSEFGLKENNTILTKMDSISNKVALKVWRPLATSRNVTKGKNTIISNREISRYSFNKSKKGNLSVKRDVDVVKNKIILKKLCFNLEASFDEVGFYPINTTYCLQLKNEEEANLKYVLGILNSKLMSYYVRNKYSETALRGGFIELRVFQVAKLPILKISKNKQKIIITLVDKILKFNKQLQSTPENSDKWNAIKKEIEKVNREINERVFEFYNLTEEEIRIVENNKN